jgi:hypothetical protein
MNTKAFAMAAGLVWGVLLFVFTLLETARGGGNTLGVLRNVFPGYSVTYWGSLIGLVYGLVSGVLIGGAFCWLYNTLAEATEVPKAQAAAAR